MGDHMFWLVALVGLAASNSKSANHVCSNHDADKQSILQGILQLESSGRTPIGISGIYINPTSGWGLFGLHLALHLAQNKSSPYFPVILEDPTIVARKAPHPMKAELDELLKTQGHVPELLRSHFTRASGSVLPFPVLHGIYGAFNDPPGDKHWGCKNVGLMFLESPFITPEGKARARLYDHVYTGAQWGVSALQDHGLDHVSLVQQGVNPRLFRPPHHTDPTVHRIGHLEIAGKFIVFSGGKLEFRKGQDLVIGAMRTFMQRHSDVLFVTAWYNLWPNTMNDISASGITKGVPQMEGRTILFSDWVAANGIPPSRYFDLGESLQDKVSTVLRHVSVGVFASRSEGGNNLVLLEAMASVVPVIVANNTGHMDIAHHRHCFPLPKIPFEGSVMDEELNASGWGNTSVADILEALEYVKANPEEAARRGKRAATFIRQHLTWDKAIASLTSSLQANNITCSCSV